MVDIVTWKNREKEDRVLTFHQTSVIDLSYDFWWKSYNNFLAVWNLSKNGWKGIETHLKILSIQYFWLISNRRYFVWISLQWHAVCTKAVCWTVNYKSLLAIKVCYSVNMKQFINSIRHYIVFYQHHFSLFIYLFIYHHDPRFHDSISIIACEIFFSKFVANNNKQSNS